ncbi:1-acyl-sn-glycerol-3-phosphate acyltransferase [Clostridium cavendishii DSM 21758]|uniref:1-acyl-sn-glycerol-3-phosphate acyltransferase n=1 Tax=Clostridium cavendishii DSM 21758 TaxID=1121302 RepID=A0A1M6BA26_9CLOT|nr:lysophospholipid acyltransferase family protein [Clostridium cavendishii]SHI45600.1 1-acyl-sn-glycerol-3-phosphate acyltransferase [Clostridium cavendishii DSM 21758]
MFRTIIWYTHFGTSLIGKIPHMYKVKKLKNKLSDSEFNTYIHKTTSKWAMSHVKLSGARVKVLGKENIPKDEPVVFISNHQGNFDIALLMSYIDKPKGYVAKVEMLKVPVLRSWMEYMHCIFLDRSNVRKSLKTILEGIEILKAGQSLVIFPEGTRSKSDKIGEFKAGSFKLATKAKVPIVPITINGSYKLMEGNNNKIKPADVEVYVHPMIKTSNLSKEEIDKLPDTVKEIIKSKL